VAFINRQLFGYDLNTHFSSIATDVDYCNDKIISELDQHVSSNTAVEALHLYCIIFEKLLPFWIFKDCASMLCEVNSIKV